MSNQRFGFIPDCGISAIEFLCRTNLRLRGFDEYFFGHAVEYDRRGSQDGVFRVCSLLPREDRLEKGFAADADVGVISSAYGIKLIEEKVGSAASFIDFCVEEIGDNRAAFFPMLSAEDQNGAGLQSFSLISIDPSGDFRLIGPAGPQVLSRSAGVDSINRIHSHLGFVRTLRVQTGSAVSSVSAGVFEESGLDAIRQGACQSDGWVQDRLVGDIEGFLSSRTDAYVIAPRIWTLVFQRKQAILCLLSAGVERADPVVMALEAVQKRWQTAWFLFGYYELKKVRPDWEKLLSALRLCFEEESRFRDYLASMPVPSTLKV